jgi:integrase
VKRSTLNKDIRNLKAFIRSCRKNRYVNREIEIMQLKEDERPVKSLTSIQIRQLLSASKPYQTLRMRILLALGTGLRRGDIQSLSVSDVDFENSYVTTRSKKTRKSMGPWPVPVPIMEELKKYVCGLDPEQEKLFNRRLNQNRWEKIRQMLGLGDFKFHDLRKTFGSVLAQNGISTAVTQKLLQHSSRNLTNKVYTNVDPVLRHAVGQIPVGDWLWSQRCDSGLFSLGYAARRTLNAYSRTVSWGSSTVQPYSPMCFNETILDGKRVFDSPLEKVRAMVLHTL